MVRCLIERLDERPVELDSSIGLLLSKLQSANSAIAGEHISNII